MTGLMDKLEDFWRRPVSAYPICAFRVLLGLYLLIYFFSFWPHVTLFFSNQGVYVPFLIPDIAPAPAGAWTVYLLTLAAITAFTLGLKARLTTPLVLVLFLYHYLLYLASGGSSYDRLIITFLVILCFARLDAALSPKSVGLNHAIELAVPAWPTRLLTVQLALFYFGAGIYKAFAPYWQTGDMLKWTLCSPWATDAAFWFVGLPWPAWLYDGLTWGIIIFECLLGLSFFHRPSRPWFLGLGVLFHISIWVFLNIPQFMVCPCAYALFLPPRTLRDCLKKLEGLFVKNNPSNALPVSAGHS